MKIAPYTQRWNDGEQDWSYVRDPSAAITLWEKVHNMNLPQDYRRFILKYNGGRVFPRMFKHRLGVLQAGPYEDETGTAYLDLLFPWEVVESHWRGETYGAGLPPHHLVIGEDPGGIQILMRVHPLDMGRIVSWYHSNRAWGTEGNTETYLLADSFSDFLQSLYDDGDDYDGWYIPAYANLAKDLDF